jgi:glycosyltransferase involved in cell wall biosynthesis
LVSHKNQAALVRAAARMTPRPTVHLIGAGDLAPELRGLGQELGVAIEMAGEWEDDDAVLEGYRAATVVVAPSRFEGFGLTPLEALAAGIPVVASDIPPHRQYLGDAVSYFALDDDLSLVAAIRTALERGPVTADLTEVRVEAATGRFAQRLAQLGVSPAPASP